MNVASSSFAIEPRMSVCLRGTAKFCEADDLSTSDHEQEQEIELLSSSLCFETTTATVEDSGDSSTTCNYRRSPSSASSVLLTGTAFSILTTSPSQLLVEGEAEAESEADSKRRQDKQRRRSDSDGVSVSVRFADSAHVRNYIHAEEITENEKHTAWFRKPEYKTIFKNNTQIINIIERKEREIKRMKSKKERENKKKKNKKYNSSKVSSIEEQPCGDVHIFCGKDEVLVRDENVLMEHIIGIHRDDEQGFSVRGLENETAKKRRTRDRTYLKAKFAVLSIQDDVDEHMFSMQERHEEKLSMIANGNSNTKGGSKNKKIIRRFSGVVNRPMPSESEEQEDSENIRRKMTEAQKQIFAVYAKAQYNDMIHQIAEKYGEICEQDARGALERGLEDERTVRAIDCIESEGANHKNCYTASIHSSINKGLSDASLEQQDRRRPSTTSTALTDESAASLALLANEGIQLSRMKRAKMFLWKFV